MDTFLTNAEPPPSEERPFICENPFPLLLLPLHKVLHSEFLPAKSKN